MRTFLCLSGFLVGLLASFALGLYLLGMVLYVFEPGEEVSIPVVAFTPKWVFLFSPLVMLGGTRRGQKGLEKVYRLFGLGL
jgi:hypothetical protein